MVTLGFRSFCLGCYRKLAISLDWGNIFFSILLILVKRLNLNNSTAHIMQQKCIHQFNKKDFNQALFRFRHKSYIYNLFLNMIFIVV